MEYTIRLANFSDLNEIDKIYNQAIEANNTADLIPLSGESRKSWFENHVPEKYPIYVIETSGSNNILGWISLSPYRSGRLALINTVEISYYLDQDFQGLGLGTRLMQFTIERAIIIGYKVLIAILLDTNKRSIKLLEKFNFHKWGYLPNVAEINNIKIGHLYYGLELELELE